MIGAIVLSGVVVIAAGPSRFNAAASDLRCVIAVALTLTLDGEWVESNGGGAHFFIRHALEVRAPLVRDDAVPVLWPLQSFCSRTTVSR